MRRTLPVVLVLLVGLLGAGAAWLWDASHSSPAAATAPRKPVVAAAAAVTTLPDLPAPATSTEPSLPGLADAHPRPGTVAQVPGPFDDRFELLAPRVSGGVVRGEVDVTSDVSDLLELQVVAAFYDRQGHLLGSSRFVHHGEDTGGEVDHRPDETRPFRITAPARIGGHAVSAAVGVPVLVNE